MTTPILGNSEGDDNSNRMVCPLAQETGMRKLILFILYRESICSNGDHYLHTLTTA